VTNKAEWKKVEAGRYVLTTDDRYTATVRKRRSLVGAWTAEAASPSGRVRGEEVCGAWSNHKTMADAKRWVLGQIDVLVQQDETELLARALRPMRRVGSLTVRGQKSEVVMSGPGDQTASFTIEGEHHTYKVTVERWNG